MIDRAEAAHLMGPGLLTIADREELDRGAEVLAALAAVGLQQTGAEAHGGPEPLAAEDVVVGLGREHRQLRRAADQLPATVEAVHAAGRQVGGEDQTLAPVDGNITLLALDLRRQALAALVDLQNADALGPVLVAGLHLAFHQPAHGVGVGVVDQYRRLALVGARLARGQRKEGPGLHPRGQLQPVPHRP